MGEEEEDPAAGPVLGPVTALVVSAAEPDVGAIFADSDAAAAVLVAVTAGGVVTVAAVAVIMPAAVAGAVPFAAVDAG